MMNSNLGSFVFYHIRLSKYFFFLSMPVENEALLVPNAV